MNEFAKYYVFQEKFIATIVADLILMAHLWPLLSIVIHKGQEIFAIFCSKMAIYAYT